MHNNQVLVVLSLELAFTFRHQVAKRHCNKIIYHAEVKEKFLILYSKIVLKIILNK